MNIKIFLSTPDKGGCSHNNLAFYDLGGNFQCFWWGGGGKYACFTCLHCYFQGVILTPKNGVTKKVIELKYHTKSGVKEI